MNNNVLVIGNGFDLAHGLDTSYEKFLDWIKSLCCDYSNLKVEGDDQFGERIKDNGFVKYFLKYTGAVPGWVDLERLIRDITKQFELFF